MAVTGSKIGKTAKPASMTKKMVKGAGAAAVAKEEDIDDIFAKKSKAAAVDIDEIFAKPKKGAKDEVAVKGKKVEEEVPAESKSSKKKKKSKAKKSAEEDTSETPSEIPAPAPKPAVIVADFSSTATKPSKSSTSTSAPDDDFANSRGASNVKRTEEGFRVYDEDFLKMNIPGSGETEDCPFECECCY
ncbi:DUF1764-domain-containing protein [Saitoella complicata NRRL Y-17804]|uniref:DUF1764-domain-containing protein n=1 Tax=Saitoella complicata (strain BCRC 22490 / CBS 7301 / JCM 7358 / NBRC 10748 / NRRL Y-17804) TaxID=698492 RepID=UPI0008680B8D|nr:DUF1764-domain-containing protein [Saitoella complicata NRRL Y-17804]ODQ50644.1 DUF1764-domain-containing protein [Saitoella complicata NRRL Y-17804]